MAKATLKCFECKQEFPRDEVIHYTSFGAQTGHYFCKKCYEIRLEREQFSNEVCRIFGVKSPGPRMWTERRRIKEKFGYTDNVIVECLRYLYDIEKHTKFSETIYRVNPSSVARMIEYQTAMKIEGNKVEDTVANNIVNKKIVFKERNRDNDQKLNIDDMLLD